MFKDEILGERKSTVIRGPREGLRVHNTQGLFTVWPSSCQTLLQERQPLAGCLCLLFLLSWEECKALCPCCQTQCCCSAGLCPILGVHFSLPLQHSRNQPQEGHLNVRPWSCVPKDKWKYLTVTPGSCVFPVFLLRHSSTILCSYKFSSCMASLQAHQGYLHTPTIFTRVLWRSKRQNQSKPCNESVPEMVINPDSLLSFAFLLGRQCCLCSALFNRPVTDFEK